MIILGNQLFEPKLLPVAPGSTVYMSEDLGLCTYVKHHKQKLVLFLSAMRSYADELRAAGFEVHYSAFDLANPPEGGRSYTADLIEFLTTRGIHHCHHFEIEDRPFEATFQTELRAAGIELTEHQSPMFLTSRACFKDYLGDRKPYMARFYQWQRKRLGLLVEEGGKPVGGKWSFDPENRKSLPRNSGLPEEPWAPATEYTADLIPWVDRNFSDHPGVLDIDHWWLPTTRKQSVEWFAGFLAQRFHSFGDFEDAISQRGVVLFHSVLSIPLNMGLLTPQEIICQTVSFAQRQGVELNSVEGFVRQIVGWREFIRGVDQNFGEVQGSRNFFNHERLLGSQWHEGTTGIPVLDDTISRLHTHGWCHHIERLMVLGNLMLMCEVRPLEAYNFFMEYFADSSDWVMGPNVYGMALFSDGGIFATKPYISGSNYLVKMSDHKKGEWCDIVDGLYWRFVEKNQSYLKGNPRLALMLGTLRKMDAGRRKKIFRAAENFIERTTTVVQ